MKLDSLSFVLIGLRMKFYNFLLVLIFILSACEEDTQAESIECRTEVDCQDDETCVEDDDAHYYCMSDDNPDMMSNAGNEMNAGVSGGVVAGTMSAGTMSAGTTTAGTTTAGIMAGTNAGTMNAGITSPEITDPLSTEIHQLTIPFDDPTDPRTVSTVLGIRHGYPENANTVILEFGPSFNAFEANIPEAYQIYSPDDDRYALDLLIEARSAVVIEKQSDIAIPNDAQDRPYLTYQVTLTLSQDMQAGSQYFVRAIGGQRGTIDPVLHHQDPWSGFPLTGGRNAIQFIYGETTVQDTQVLPDLIASVMGLREITIVSPTHLRFLVGASGIPTGLDNPASFTITSEDDDSFSGGLQPTAVGRRSYPEVFVPGYGYPFPRKLNIHEIYLELPTALSNGSNYVFSIANDATQGREILSLLYTDDTTHNHHLKVNQLGYTTQSPVKIALLGAWMGTLGTMSYSEMDNRRCILVNDETGEEVFETTLSLYHDAQTQDEGAYQENFSLENIYLCDFSDFAQVGQYFIKVDGMGRSYTFEINDDVYHKAFKTTMRGIFYQRSGQALNTENSLYRRLSAHVEPVEIPYMENKPIIGGHYDAGDYNPRVHIDVMHILMLAYEMFPQKFYDGQIDIPENTNGVPDILDEAGWGLRTLLELQDEDGGVGYDSNTGNFIESHDPNFVEIAIRDPWIQESYDKHARGTLITAALMANASRLWGSVGRSTEAMTYLDAAERAYTWAKQNDAETYTDDYAWAAAELFKTTRQETYLTDFMTSGYAVAGTLDDGNINRLRAALTLATDFSEEADSDLSHMMYTTIRNVGDILKRGCTYAYPHFQHPYAPVNWGTAAYPHTIESMVALWAISANEEYLTMMVHSADFSLGLNPLNKSWTTGLGDNPIYGPTHLFGWSTFQGIIPPGLQAEGPNHDADYIARFMNENTPTPNNTPKYYNYYDVRYSIALNEGVVKNQAWTAFLYGALLPDRP